MTCRSRVRDSRRTGICPAEPGSRSGRPVDDGECLKSLETGKSVENSSCHQISCKMPDQGRTVFGYGTYILRVSSLWWMFLRTVSESVFLGHGPGAVL